MGIWQRAWGSQLPWQSGNQAIVQIPPGRTLLRVHFQWGFGGETSPLYDAMANTRTRMAIFGLCTVPHGSSVPSAVTLPEDVDPPTQRWIYWEARPPIVGGLDVTGGGVVAWRDSGGGTELSTKGQVLATNLGGATSLDLFASWGSPQGAWDASGAAHVWFWASALYSEG